MMQRPFVFLMLSSMALSATAEEEHRVQDRFVGEWLNENSETRSFTKFIVRKSGRDRCVQAWGACTPKDCDLGETRFNLLGDSVNAEELPYGFATWQTESGPVHIVFRLKAATLVAESYKLFTDGSQRSNFHSVENMKRNITVAK